MYAKHPKMAKEWTEHTSAQEQARLPEHVAREKREKSPKAPKVTK